jgi:hypothetical protein
MILQACLLAIFQLEFLSIQNEDKIDPFVRKRYNLIKSSELFPQIGIFNKIFI